MSFMLKGKLTELRPFEPGHLADPKYIGWLRDYDVIKTINRIDYVRPVSQSEVREYCDHLMTSHNDVFVAVHRISDDAFIGTVKAGNINWRTRVADIGVLIGDKDAWGQGIATDALRTLCTYLFERLDMRRLTCGVMAVNPAIQRVFEKLGFQHEGTFREQDLFEGEYVDHIYLGCLRDEFNSGKTTESNETECQ